MTSRFLLSVGVLWGVLWGGVRVGQAQTESEVLQARQRGIEFLKSKQTRDGNWEWTGHETGITALCTIALIENGVPLTDPVVQKGYQYVQKNYSTQKNTYDLALSVVLLSRLGDRRDKPRIRALAARLVAGQLEGGGWTYNCPIVEPDVLEDPTRLPKPKEGFGDNSCTQFAVLGLWVASRTGVKIERTLELVAKRFSTTQTEDGGWSYTYEVAAAAGDAKSAQKAPSGPSMTGAGLFCLAVAQATQIREALKKQKAAGATGTGGSVPSQSLLENRVFEKGLKRTGEFVVTISPGTVRYFLWSVERLGVRFQMDPPTLKPPIPWGGLVVKGGSLRLLNCVFSESNKQGTAAVVVEAPGQVVVRNSLLVGGRAGIEFVGNGRQEVIVDNSILFSNAGFSVTNDAKTKAAADVTVNIINSIIQVKDVVHAPKLTGAINVACYRSALQADWIGSNFLAVAGGPKDRAWKGNANIYDVRQWIGFNGAANTTVKDGPTWNTFWGGTDKASYKRVMPYAGGVARQMGSFSHAAVAQEWQLEIPSDAPQELQRGIIGINSYLAGPGSTFDQYRDTISYTDWQQGKLGIAEVDSGAGKATAVAK